MQEFTTIGTYAAPCSGDGQGYGVWGQITLDISGRKMPVDVRITPPDMSQDQADEYAVDLYNLHTTTPEHPIELLLMSDIHDES